MAIVQLHLQEKQTYAICGVDSPNEISSLTIVQMVILLMVIAAAARLLVRCWDYKSMSSNTGESGGGRLQGVQ